METALPSHSSFIGSENLWLNALVPPVWPPSNHLQVNLSFDVWGRSLRERAAIFQRSFLEEPERFY